MSTDSITGRTNSITKNFDFSECEREPICHPGAIQAHGQLLALNSAGTITYASENLGGQFAIGAREALGRTLAQLMGPASNRLLNKILPQLRPGQLHHELFDARPEPRSLWAHARGDRFILEWEDVPFQELEARKALEADLEPGLEEIASSKHIHRQTQIAADLTRHLTGFDRVMIYQFHPDWSGEVVAEARHLRSEPFLGLRYPATDIPPQARQLYRENLLRVLVDVNGPTSGLVSIPSEPNALDLTMAQLRAISPYHLQYLRNMRVGATATASIMANGELWGLIACHHDLRKQVSPSERQAISAITNALSQAVTEALSRTARVSWQRLESRQRTLEASMPDGNGTLTAILFGPERLRNLLRAAGTAVWTNEGVLRMGDSPTAPEIEHYAAKILAGGEHIVTVGSRADLATGWKLAPANESLAGLIAIVISTDPGLILFGFRQESVRELTWGGDVNQPVEVDERTGKLSPRRSFAQYKQSVAGVANEWSNEDLSTAHIVRDVVRSRCTSASSTAYLIHEGFSRIRALASDDRPIQDSLLDAIGSGISLLFRSDSAEPRVRYANQSLLDLAETWSDSSEVALNADTLLEALGLPGDLLAVTETKNLQVTIPSMQEGMRHFLVERKLALEIRDSQGTVSLSALLFTDTTRSERAREALQSAQARAEHLAYLKSSFLANMSHEIRTPMNGILGMVQLLQGMKKDPQQQRYLDVIQRSGDEMLNVINDILDLSKIESGRMTVENVAFDLTAVVEGVVDLLRPKAFEKAIDLSARFDFPAPRGYFGDPSRLRQILLNIVGNAVKFTDVGHVLVRVQCEVSGSPVTISISDTGIGIPSNHLPHVFDKFRQADQSTTRKHGGSGLGLAISRELAGLMGGSISVTSQAGAGSTFIVTLPLWVSAVPRDEAGKPEVEDATVNRQPGLGHRILVAEDNKINQSVIEAMLQTKGFEVKIAESGRQVLDYLETGTCDLILMDCQMPDLDGYQTTARIRALEGALRHTPIIALTANALPEDRQKCLNAGMDDYIPKPIQMNELWRTLEKWDCLPSK